MTWLLLKSFFSNALGFIIAHWQAVLVALICLYAFHERNAHRASVKAFDDFKSAQTALVLQRQVENAKKDTDADQLSTINQVFHNAEMTKLKLDRDTIKKGLNDEKVIIARVLNAHSVQNSSSNSVRLPQVPAPTSVFAESGDECNRTVATLTQAGQSCAIDFNSCRSAWDGYCDIYGCK